MSIDSALADHLQQRFPVALQFLQDLVSTNSFTLNAAGVDANAQRIIQQFAPLLFKVRQVPCSHPGAGQHLILDSGGSGPTIALISHLDTVFSPEEEKLHNFHWLRDGDRIYGPGTIDIKGGTVLLWMMLDALSATQPELFGEVRWIVLLNAAEEILAPDFSALCRNIWPADTRACLVFEGDNRKEGGFGLVNSRKGSAHFTVNVTGRSAHAGAAYRNGANAIHQLSRVIERMMALTDLENETTVNVGVVSGGSVRNTVPDHAHAELEVRSFDEKRYQKVRDAMLAMNGPGEIKSVNGGHACQIEVVNLGENPCWPQNPSTDYLVELWRQAAASCDIELSAGSRGGLSDGNALWKQFPTIDGLGPRGGNLHCSHRSEDGSKEPEFVDATSFVPKALVNCLAVLKLVEGN